MKNTIIKKKLFFILIVIITISLVGLYYIDTNIKIQQKKCTNKIQKELNKKIENLDNIIKELIKTSNIHSFQELNKKGFIIIIYRGDSLLNWSDNTIFIPLKYDTSYFSKKFSFYSNGWYFTKNFVFNEYKIIGLIKIKSEYPYTNKYLKNEFQEDFNLSQEIELKDIPGQYNIYDDQGNFLFSIHIKGLTDKTILNSLPLIFYIFILIAFFFIINEIIKKQKSFAISFIFLIVTVIFILSFRIFQTLAKFPSFLYDSYLFNPIIFASSDFLPSLGDLLLNSIIFSSTIILILQVIKKINSGSFLLLSILKIIFITYFFLTIYSIKILILNSSISFELHKLIKLNLLTFIAFFIISIHFITLLYTLFFILKEDYLLTEKSIFVFILLVAISYTGLNVLGFKIDLIYIIFLVTFYLIIAVLRKIFQPDSYTYLVFQLVFISLLSIYCIFHYNDQKEKQNMQIIAENLSHEHDPIAEYLFEEITQRINNDTTFKNILFNLEIPYDEIYRYLRDNYFKGYWIKYNLQFYDCRPTDSIVFKIPEEYNFHCYGYFEKLIEKYGMHLPNSNFYYLKNKSGRINYLGVFKFSDKNGNSEMSIFIELETRQNTELPGYPAILLDENVNRTLYFKDYSYAKYKNGILVSKYGNFSYSYREDYFNCPENQNIFYSKIGKFLHLLYKSDKDTTIVISKPALNVFDIITSFSYLFLFYYIIFLLIYAFYKFRKQKNINLNIKNKIQIALILILIVSLIFTGVGIIFFSIKQQEQKNFEYLSEKLQSIYAELDSKFAFESKIDIDKIFLNNIGINQFIYKLSDVFYTDINLYSVDGVLISTSRPEIFNRKLIGNLMNPEAFYEIVWNAKTEFIHYEKIGKLKYLSAYMPYVNAKGKFLGFINLPYFIKEDIVRKEIMNLLVTISNIYVLLILLTLLISTFLSNTITRNLKLLQERFSKIELLKKHELIEYEGNDEIAGLVNEYNRMVVELQRNAELLAKSEREMAWREMAKQVAHEIKNPLTPMKLNVQYLEKAWKERREDFQNVLNKVTKTLIEQIDNLSKIASEFSNFAKMPQPINEKIDLLEVIDKIQNLYLNQNVNFKIVDEINKPVYIFADKNQILRAFINLVNNGIQSVPEDRNPEIQISFKRVGNIIHIEIKDNGRGIPEELKDKLFIPNFTTKSSGMGLGLAITKNIIELAGGAIDFVSEIDKGTTFIIKLPEFANN